jgi:hypothetical protein
MKITPKMIEEGWKKNEFGEWIAPGVRTATYTDGKNERVLLVETRQDVDSDNGSDGEFVPPTKKEIEKSQLHAYQRCGLSRAEAIRAVELGNGKVRFNQG